MKRFIKRSACKGEAGFLIDNASGVTLYRAVFCKTRVSTRYKIAVTDANGCTVLRIRRLPLVGTNTYLFRKGKTRVTFSAVPTKNGVYTYFYGNNWHILGDLATKNFTVIDVDKTEICRHFRHTDYCELDIFDAEQELFCIATSICANLLNTVDRLEYAAV